MRRAARASWRCIGRTTAAACYSDLEAQRAARAPKGRARPAEGRPQAAGRLNPSASDQVRLRRPRPAALAALRYTQVSTTPAPQGDASAVLTDDFDYELPSRAHRPRARRAARLLPPAGARAARAVRLTTASSRICPTTCAKATSWSSTTRECFQRGSSASRTRPAAPSRCCCCASAMRAPGSAW